MSYSAKVLQCQACFINVWGLDEHKLVLEDFRENAGLVPFRNNGLQIYITREKGYQTIGHDLGQLQQDISKVADHCRI